MRKGNGSAQIYQFPLPLDSAGFLDSAPPGTAELARATHNPNAVALSTEVVISGTFRKDNEGLRRTYEELRDLGCRVLSPTSIRVVSETDGFVFMEGEQRERPEDIEVRHLGAIQEAQFVWLHAPDGYVGLSAALEVGFARAVGIPVYSVAAVSDPILASFVERVGSMAAVVEEVRNNQRVIPNPLLQSFQKYYKRAAVERGYANEGARDTVLLMVEEIGELARAIRKKEKLQRHGHAIREEAPLELADVFIYVVHLANVLGVNLSDVVRQKELLNLQKVFRSTAAK